MFKKWSTLVLLFIIVYLVVAYFPKLQNQPPVVLSDQVSTQGSSSLYPNPTMTPGDIFSNVSMSDICTRGYTKSVRNVPVEIKRQVYAEYGVLFPQQRGAYEVDHFIPLELGGSNDIKNLWLEPAFPTPGFHQKDIVENYLHEKVCSGKEDLTQAQKEIRSDWYAVYKRIPNPQQFVY